MPTRGGQGGDLGILGPGKNPLSDTPLICGAAATNLRESKLPLLAQTPASDAALRLLGASSRCLKPDSAAASAVPRSRPSVLGCQALGAARGTWGRGSGRATRWVHVRLRSEQQSEHTVCCIPAKAQWSPRARRPVPCPWLLLPVVARVTASQGVLIGPVGSVVSALSGCRQRWARPGVFLRNTEQHCKHWLSLTSSQRHQSRTLGGPHGKSHGAAGATGTRGTWLPDPALRRLPHASPKASDRGTFPAVAGISPLPASPRPSVAAPPTRPCLCLPRVFCPAHPGSFVASPP